MVALPVCGLLPSSPVTMSTVSSPVRVAFCTSMMVGDMLSESMALGTASLSPLRRAAL